MHWWYWAIQINLSFVRCGSGGRAWSASCYHKHNITVGLITSVSTALCIVARGIKTAMNLYSRCNTYILHTSLGIWRKFWALRWVPERSQALWHLVHYVRLQNRLLYGFPKIDEQCRDWRVSGIYEMVELSTFTAMFSVYKLMTFTWVCSMYRCCSVLIIGHKIIHNTQQQSEWRRLKSI